jgi:hypothetical protein
MKLSEYIKKLQQLESQGYGDLVVCISDWSEGYADPAEMNEVSVEDSQHTIGSSGSLSKGLFVRLGSSYT